MEKSIIRADEALRIRKERHIFDPRWDAEGVLDESLVVEEDDMEQAAILATGPHKLLEKMVDLEPSPAILDTGPHKLLEKMVYLEPSFVLGA